MACNCTGNCKINGSCGGISPNRKLILDNMFETYKEILARIGDNELYYIITLPTETDTNEKGEDK